MRRTVALTNCWATEDRRECCHNCEHHVPDWSHPCTDGGRITQRRGWICHNPEVGSFSEWSFHGLCECWEPATFDRGTRE